MVFEMSFEKHANLLANCCAKQVRSSYGKPPLTAALVAVQEAIAERKDGALESTWTSRLADKLSSPVQKSGKLASTLDADFKWTGTQFKTPPNLDELLQSSFAPSIFLLQVVSQISSESGDHHSSTVEQ